MSTPTEIGSTAPAPTKEKTGVGRMLTRVKTIMKRAEKRLSISGTSKATPPVAKPAPVEPAAVPEPAPAAPAAAPTATAAPAAAADADAPAIEVDPAPAPALAQEIPGATRVPRMQLHEERARRLGERFGIEISPSEWHATEGDALRVNKPIRMRVRRTCHECNANLGTAKQCPKCEHVRCKKCPRYPPKRTEAEKQAARERRAQATTKEPAAHAPVAVTANWELPKNPFVLSLPSRTGGQDLVYKKPRQRLRRNCCQCQSLFAGGNKSCAQCSHIRCTDCPRDPAKANKYPYGYPGDVFGANSVPHYQCHLCETKYPDNTPEGTACTRCAHPRCDSCPRMKPQRVEPEPDPEILKLIEVRLTKLTVE